MGHKLLGSKIKLPGVVLWGSFFCVGLVAVLAGSPIQGLIIPHFVAVHTFLEAACILVSLMIFMSGFVVRKYSLTGLFPVMGIPFLGVGILDLFHTLSYTGLPDFITPNSLQKAIGFWFAARILEAITFLNYALLVTRRWKLKVSAIRSSILVTVVIGTALLLNLAFPQLLPTFTQQNGTLTGIKVAIEYVLIAVHVVVFVVLYGAKSNTFNDNLAYLTRASFVIAMSGLLFASFNHPHNAIIFMGHVLKTAAYYFIFKATLQMELLSPYKKLVEIAQVSEERLRSIQDIESRLLQAERLGTLGLSTGAILHDLKNVVGVSQYAVKRIISLLEENAEAYRVLDISKLLLKSLDKTSQFQKLFLNQAREANEEIRAIDLETELTPFSQVLKAIVGPGCAFEFLCDSNLVLCSNSLDLERMLLNLVSNARDALKDAKSGKISVAVKKREVSSWVETTSGKMGPGIYVQFSVSDDGAGIPKDQLNNIFKPFFTTKERDHGTGLGLVTVRDLANKHNGFVDVKSALGQGTEFSVFFPLNPLMAPNPSREAAEELHV